MKLTIVMMITLLSPAAFAAGEKQPPSYQIPLPPRPDFSSLKWILGHWTGQTLKQSPPAKIHLSVSTDLDQRVMVFREEISFTATKTAPAARESSIGILTGDPSDDSFLLQVYSSTGFITRYRVTVAGPEINFNPAGGSQPPPGWLSRRVVDRTDVEGFTETVQWAPPQKSFFDYYTAKFKRDAASKNSTAAAP